MGRMNRETVQVLGLVGVERAGGGEALLMPWWLKAPVLALDVPSSATD